MVNTPASIPPRPARRRVRRILIWTAAALGISTAVLAGAFLFMLITEAGARAAWSLARTVSGGRLSGALEGGTLASGIHLRAVHWRNGDTELRIDRLDGQWALSRAPLRLKVHFLHIGTIDAHIPPSPDTPEKTPLPESLTLPLALDIQDVRMERLRIHNSASITEFSGVQLRAASDGQRHQIHIEPFETPFGTVSAQAQLDGQRPFTVTGAAHFTGKVQDEAVQLDARVSGSLKQLIAEIDVSGLKLTAHARVEATPFADVPLKMLTLTADHLNPRLFSAQAPHADIALRAQLAPLPNRDDKNAGLVVVGPISITNAQPGPLHQQRLPLIDAHANVQLDAHTQAVSNLRIRLIQGARIEGDGAFKTTANSLEPFSVRLPKEQTRRQYRDRYGRSSSPSRSDGGDPVARPNGEREATPGKPLKKALNGRFDLQAHALDLNIFADTLRKTQLSGPITLSSTQGAQHITVDIADAKAALRAQADITLDAAQMALNTFKLQTGQGHVEVSGMLKKDTPSNYQLQAVLNNFVPFALLHKPPQPHTARLSGTLNAAGRLAPSFETQLTFALRDSVYAGLPLTGTGTVQLTDKRLLPSTTHLSIAGNRLALHGSLGRASDTLNFKIDAPQLSQIGFGLDGALKAGGTLSGTLTHPKVAAHYQANALTFGKNRIGQLKGQLEWQEGAHGALAFNADGRDIVLPQLTLRQLDAQLTGTRANHLLTLNTAGRLLEQPLNVRVAARGGLIETRAGTGWAGTLSQLESHGLISAQLKTPMTIRAGPEMLTLGATQLLLENALLDLRTLDVQRGRIRSTGTLKGLSVNRLLRIQQTLTGKKAALNTTLVLDGDWDFALSESTATGAIQLARRSGDLQRDHVPIGLSALSARLDLSNQKRANLSVRAQAARLGTFEARAQAPLTFADGRPNLADRAPLTGAITAEVPTLKRIGTLLGPQYLLDGRGALNLILSGSVAQPKLSGTLTGDNLSVTLIDEGVTLKNGVVRIAVTNNRADFQKVEFQGASGTVRATGSVALDRADTPLSVQIVADALELFARPDRQLSISGRATLANRGTGGFSIDGDFKVNRAFFNLPASAAPRLSDDVVIVQANSKNGSAAPQSRLSKSNASTEEAAKVHLFQTRIGIDLGQDFRFLGAGADLDLVGKITLSNAPGVPLRAHGDLRTRSGSTYEVFGTKLDIEKGYVTFNGPVDNPALNILAMRRNQTVEAGIQIRGTTHTPRAQLISEPNVPDTEKLSWLLFGRGTDKGVNPGQQHAKSAALAFLGSMGGKKIAQSIGLDELSIGQSEVGLTDPQVVTLAKALNRHFILGYEQGLTSGAHLFKMTWQFWRSWSIIVHAGTVNGINLLFNQRFD